MTHREQSQKYAAEHPGATTCAAWHMTFGGCLNCGWQYPLCPPAVSAKDAAYSRVVPK